MVLFFISARLSTLKPKSAGRGAAKREVNAKDGDAQTGSV